MDVSDLAAGGGTISGPQFAMLVVTVESGGQAMVEDGLFERFPAEEPVEEPAASPPAGETESAAEIESPYDDEAGPHAEGGPHEQAGHDDEVVDEKAAEAGPPSPGKVERAGGADADAAVTQVMRWNRPSVSEARDH